MIVTFPAAMKVENFKRFFSENALLRSLSVSCWYSYVTSQPFFTPQKTRMCMNLDHMDSGHFVLTWERRSLRVRLLVIGSKTVSMPPTKICPQCKAAVPVRQKTCERCDLVFRFKRKAVSYLLCTFCFVSAYAKFAHEFLTLFDRPCATCL